MSASRRIPKNIGKNDTFKGYQTEDLVMGLMPMGLVLVFIQVFPEHITEAISLPAMGIGLVLGIVLIAVTPDHLSTKEWVFSIFHHMFRPKRVEHVSLQSGVAREQRDAVTETKIYQMEERTQDITRLKNIHRNGGGIERDDRAMVGAVKVEPANMALASNQRWQMMVEEWEGYLNNSVEYPLQIYATSRPFPVEDYVTHYYGRINDPDIENRPILQELLSDFLDWYPQYLSWQGTNQREYYVIVPVKRDELIGADSDEKSPLEVLAGIPIIGIPFQSQIEKSGNKSEEEKTTEQLRVLSQRLREVNRQGIRSLSGCDGRRISGVEMAILIREFWSGREYEGDPEEVVRSQPILRKSNENAVTQEEVANDTGHGGTDSNTARSG